MELVHANQDLVDIQQLTIFTQWDVVSGLGFTYKDNDFELTIPEEVWATEPILRNHFIYEAGTEWGGLVEGLKHSGTDITLTGPTWRGLLAYKIVCPPPGEAYMTITNMDAHTAISMLIGSSLGNLFAVSRVISGVIVSGTFRYANLLDSIQSMLSAYGARLCITFENGVVMLSVVTVSILSEELSQDFSIPMMSEQSSAKAFNHIIALGVGEGTDRLVIELYRTDDGTITTVPISIGIYDKQTTLDLPDIELPEELYREAYFKLANCKPTSKITLDMSGAEVLNLNLGDRISGHDYVTGLSIIETVTQVIRTVNRMETIQYKMGDN